MKLRQAEHELALAVEELDAKEQSLMEMRAKYDEAITEKQKLQDDAELTKRRLESAESLISNLADKKERWEEQRDGFDDKIIRLVGDTALAASFISYAGPFYHETRLSLLQSWTTV